jgi:hypothetical protein
MVESQLPELKSHVGKRGKLKMPPDDKIRQYEITDEICVPQTDNPKKVFCLQHIQYQETGRIELRLCYFIIGKKEGMKGKWTYGQYAPLMPLKDFKAIVTLAQKKGWL